jgi:hypothetical protein
MSVGGEPLASLPGKETPSATQNAGSLFLEHGVANVGLMRHRLNKKKDSGKPEPSFVKRRLI